MKTPRSEKQKNISQRDIRRLANIFFCSTDKKMARFILSRLAYISDRVRKEGIVAKRRRLKALMAVQRAEQKNIASDLLQREPRFVSDFKKELTEKQLKFFLRGKPPATKAEGQIRRRIWEKMLKFFARREKESKRKRPS